MRVPIYVLDCAVQPIVGAYSDMCTHRLGRRRPFLFLGLLTTLIGMALFANATALGSLLSAGKGAAIFVATVGTVILVAAINAIQGPCRALASDLTSPEQSVLVSACFAFMCGTGQLVGYWTAHIDLKAVLPFLADGSQVRAPPSSLSSFCDMLNSESFL